MKSKNYQKLTCVKCKKIIVEAETIEKLKDILGDNQYINCPYCGHTYQNPFW